MKLVDLRHGGLQAATWIQDEESNIASRGTAVLKTIARTIVSRDQNDSQSTCEPGNDSARCEKPVSSETQTLPIVLGVIIPLACALVVFIWLHRRNKKKQALEDINDPHRSLDFGLDPKMPPPPAAKRKRGKNGAAEMIDSDIDAPFKKGHAKGQYSMDMLESPFVLPGALNNSRESLHSMSRSFVDYNDPYRPVSAFSNHMDRARSPLPFNENGSTYSGSTYHYGINDKSNLVVNAQRMSASYPERGASLIRMETKSSGEVELHAPIPKSNAIELPSRNTSGASSEHARPVQTAPRVELPATAPPAREAVEETPAFPFASKLPTKELPLPPVPNSTSESFPQRKASAGLGLQITVDDRPISDASSSAAVEPPPPPPKFVEEPEEMQYDIHPGLMPEEDQGYDIHPSLISTGRLSVDNSHQYVVQNNRLSVLGLRPLPPDHPEENPEQRANRIRSFYKEYFDVNKPTPANAYYEDYDASYNDNNYYYEDWYDPDSLDYYQPPPPQPWAQPMGRRAMTPPPRGVPRFEGAAHERNYSTMSGGRGPYRGRPPPKKNLPPPKTLTSLPTPHLLKEDSALFNASDFAPPTSFREVQNGRRPDSPMGTQRPFSPAVAAYNPLVSSFQGLSPIPSPHSLRKSGTFTSLDFTPAPPRYRKPSIGGSDAGSIRSARSGISAMQMDAVRSGAYRVSRIPKEYVTSKDDFSNQLRPKWNLTTPA